MNSSQAGHLSEYESTSRTLTAVLAEADYPPFYYVSDGQLTGISIDVLAYAAKKLNIKIVYKRLSWPRVLQSLERGNVDLVTTFFRTPARAKDVVYVQEPHATESNHLFTLNDADITFDGDLHTLSDKLVGTIKGYSYGDEFDHADYLNKNPVLNERTLVRMMLGHRFDVAIGNPYAIELAAKQQGGAAHLRFLEPPVDSSPIYMAFSRVHSGASMWAAEFTRVIRELKGLPAYQRILERHAPQPGTAFSVKP